MEESLRADVSLPVFLDLTIDGQALYELTMTKDSIVIEGRIVTMLAVRTKSQQASAIRLIT